MRLTPDEISVIKQVATRTFGEVAELRLFGSRVDDNKRGGDVDLYIAPIDKSDLYTKRLHCITQLEMQLLYPVNLVVDDGLRNLPIYRIARREGVAL